MYYHKMKQMKPFTRGGIGHAEAEFPDLGLLHTNSLTNRIREVVTIAHLSKLEAVKIVHDGFDGAEVKDKMLYFIENG